MATVLNILFFLALCETLAATGWFCISFFTYGIGKTTDSDMAKARSLLWFSSLSFLVLATVYNYMRIGF